MAKVNDNVVEINTKGLNSDNIKNVVDILEDYKTKIKGKGETLETAIKTNITKAIKGSDTINSVNTFAASIKLEIEELGNFVDTYVDALNNVLKATYEKNDMSNETFKTSTPTNE